MGAWEQVLVFTRTKHGANRLAEYLGKNGLPAAAIHGNKSQSARTKALADFKANKIRVLVATDIAARGLDIDQLPHVVNFELPNVAEDYVHRIGRTGRAGRSGEAVSLVSPDEEKLLRAIERMTRQKFEEGDLKGFVPPAQPELNSDRPERPRGGAPARGRGQRPAAAAPRGQGRNDQPRNNSNNKPRRPQQARAGILEPEDAVTRERRLQAMGNKALPDEHVPARQPRNKREKPALLG